MSDSTQTSNASGHDGTAVDNDVYNRDVLLQQANDPKTLAMRNLLGKRWHKDAFGNMGKPMHPVGNERGGK